MKTKKKKVFAENWCVFSLKSGEDQTKKKVFTAILDYIRPEFKGFMHAGWLFFISSSSAQISMGMLNLDGGTLTLDGGTRPPYNLSTGYIAICWFTHETLVMKSNFEIDLDKVIIQKGIDL